MVTFYDIRHSMEAARCLQGAVLHGKRMDIHYGIPKDNPSEEEQNNGTLFVRNLDASVTTEDIKAKFGKYGPIKEVRSTPGKRGHRFVEFYDTRHAKNAMDAENNTLLRGNIITIELSRPGGQYQRLLRHGFTQPQPQPQPMYEEIPHVSPMSAGGCSPSAGPTSYPPPPLPLERRIAMLSINSAYSNTGGRSMPLSVPDASQLEPQAPQQHQFFGGRSSHSRATHNMGRTALEPYNPMAELGPSPTSRPSQSLMAPVPPAVEELPINRRTQRPALRRESSSSQALSRQFTVSGSGSLYQPPLYSPPMSSFSPVIFSSTPESSGSTTSTPSSAVEPTGTISLGLGLHNGLPFLPAMSSTAGAPGGNVPVSSSATRHRPSLSTPAPALRDFIDTPVIVDHAPYLPQSSSPQYAVPAAPQITRQTSPPHHGSGSSSPSPVIHSAMAMTVVSSSAPSIPAVSGAAAEGELPAASTSPSTDPSYDVIVKDGVVTDPRTTLYIKNIPHRVQPASLLSVMIGICPNNAFQFLYLPNSKQNTRSNNGYAFVKLNSTEYIPRIVSVLNGNHWPQYNTERKCEVKYASIQSFQRLLQQFDSTTLLTDRDRWRPFILYHGDYTQLTPEIFAETRDPAAVDSEEKTSAPVTAMIATQPVAVVPALSSTTTILPMQQDQQRM